MIPAVIGLRSDWARRWARWLALATAIVWASHAFAAGREQLVIRTQDGRQFTFAAELPQTPAEFQTGLMNRPGMAADSAMLFDFQTEKPVTFWMKNTLFPLDMLFIGADGGIRGIKRRAMPRSLDHIDSPGPVRAVLEVNGGTADLLQLRIGDHVVAPNFGSSK